MSFDEWFAAMTSAEGAIVGVVVLGGFALWAWWWLK